MKGTAFPQPSVVFLRFLIIYPKKIGIFSSIRESDVALLRLAGGKKPARSRRAGLLL